MPLLADGNAIIPAPLVNIEKRVDTAEDGTFLGQMYTITLTGSIVAVPPGAAPVEQSARLGVLLAKQAALSAQFSKPGVSLEIYSPNGTGLVQCNARVVSVQFAEGIWVDRTDYTIVLESPNLYPTDPEIEFSVFDVSESWNIEEASLSLDPVSDTFKPVWQLTHTLSAKGRSVYDINGTVDPEGAAWKQARDWVLDRIENGGFDGRPFDTKDEMKLAGANQGYNHTRLETVDILAGTFSITETWTLAYGLPAIENYTISLTNNPSEPSPHSINISGSVTGLSQGLNTPQERITNATNYFNANVKDKVFARLKKVFPDIPINEFGVSGTIDYNYAEGSISYNYVYDDSVSYAEDTVYDNYTVSKRNTMEEYETTVTVQGTIIGRLRLGEPNSNFLKYERAKIYWDALVAGNELALRAAKSGVNNLKPSPIGNNVDFNFSEGSISYSYEFNNRLNNSAKNDYTITFRTSREDGRTTVRVDGIITGLRNSLEGSPTEKYINALAFWESWETQIRSRASAFAPGITLNPEPMSRSRGDNELQGTIQYNYEYNTDKSPTIPDALSEHIVVNDTHPSDVFAVIPVLNRPRGPILQATGSKKERSRTISMDVVMKPNVGKPSKTIVDATINSYRPIATITFTDRDEESWDENTGRYTRNVTFVYEE